MNHEGDASEQSTLAYSVVLKNATVAYGDLVVLDDFSLTVPPGTRLAILGRNAAGKSTLFRTILGQMRPQKGICQIGGIQSANLPRQVREEVGYLPDVPVPYRWMKVKEHLNFVASFYRRWDDKWAQQLLDRFAISPKSRLRQLSRGTLEKLLFTSTICSRPRLLICDEPFTNVDLVARGEILALMSTYSLEEEATILLASHRMEDVELLADEVAFVANKRIQCQVSLKSLKQNGWQHVVFGTGCSMEELELPSVSLNREQTSWIVADENQWPVGKRIGASTVQSSQILGDSALATLFRLTNQSTIP